MKTQLSHLIFAQAIILSSFFVSCSKEEAPPEFTEIFINNKEFNPLQVSIPIGTTVVWKNMEDTPHTVTSTSNEFNSGEIRREETYSHIFSTPGNFTYYCKFNPDSKATITVK